MKDFLHEDIGTGDITTNSIISRNIRANARIICNANEQSVVCGLEEASIIFDICKCKSHPIVKDGELISTWYYCNDDFRKSSLYSHGRKNCS